MTPYFLITVGLLIFTFGACATALFHEDIGTGFSILLFIIITVFASTWVFVGVSVINL